MKNNNICIGNKCLEKITKKEIEKYLWNPNFLDHIKIGWQNEETNKNKGE